MRMPWPFRRELRSSLEDPKVPISSPHILQFLGMAGISASGETVTIDSALGVPAIWAAVNFNSGTLAGLPAHVYNRTRSGRERNTGPLARMLHDAVNDGMSSFEWRKWLFDQVFTGGRAVTFIERNDAGRPINLWPLDPNGVTIRRTAGRKLYEYRDGTRGVVYEAAEVIDVPFMLRADMIRHRSPILSNRDVIGLAQAVTKYGSKYFQSGGVAPFVLEGNFTTPGAIDRASEQFTTAINKASQEGRLALPMPAGHTLKELGANPEKAQLVEVQRFLVEQIARIYSLPPTFLQDLTHGTFQNTEQQDLHYTKHSLRRWIQQFEQELNLKLFGRNSNRTYVEINVDGLLRGDFKTRMDGYATAVQNAVMKPNEARRLENLPDDPEGDRLLVQGATVPLGGGTPAPEPTDGEEDDDA